MDRTEVAYSIDQWTKDLQDAQSKINSICSDIQAKTALLGDKARIFFYAKDAIIGDINESHVDLLSLGKHVLLFGISHED